jgi:hypothetical protein
LLTFLHTLTNVPKSRFNHTKETNKAALILALHSIIIIICHEMLHFRETTFSNFRCVAIQHSPVNECSLSIHQIELVIQSSPSLSNSCRVGQHANSPLNPGQVTSWYGGRRLIVDAHLESVRETSFYYYRSSLSLQTDERNCYFNAM